MVRPARFDRKWQSRRKRGKLLRRLGWWIVIIGLVFAAWWSGLIPNMATRDARTVDQTFGICGQGGGSAACVPDGDTIVFGGGETRRRVRLTGFDAPEMDGKCDAERVQAVKARTALAAWLNTGPFHWDGGDDPPYDKYGRELRSAWRETPNGDGDIRREWLADHMIARGLASQSGWDAAENDWCEPA
ncbi:thermonuclease family protein [Erythrobacter sp. W53]|uniref:thermonuclease family protein n=1 Tax=Erythrobacter sp. W53 TaxID=3425947 RepID=UPI003D7683DE